MAYFLTTDEKQKALFHLRNAEDWFAAMKKECEKEPTSTVYLREKARQVVYALDAVNYICDLAEKKEVEQ